MVRTVSFEPDWALPPGKTISAIAHKKRLSLESLARDLNFSLSALRRLIVGDTSIDESLASALERALGPSAKFWLSRETQYRADLTRIGASRELADQKELLSKLPLTDMKKFGWLPPTENRAALAKNCLHFFDVESVAGWRARYHNEIAVAAFRTSATFSNDPFAVTAWLRRAYAVSNEIVCGEWDAKGLRRIIPQMRALGRIRQPESYIPKLQALCASVGIAFVVVPAPKGCRASGATRFLTPEKALLILSFRHRSDDHFWFTFFHEIGHLVLHGSSALFIEDESHVTETEEVEANDFAAEILIPSSYHHELIRLGRGAKEIIAFARRVGISPGVVVGQLQHRSMIERNKLNSLKRRYIWDDFSSYPRLSP